MEIVVMQSAQRHGELITNLHGQAAGLCKSNVMGMTWQIGANRTWLGTDAGEMLLIPDSALERIGEDAFVDGGTKAYS